MDSSETDPRNGDADRTHQPAPASAEVADSVTHEQIHANGVELHCALAGPADGELVVCLHGFPECWYAWSEQIPALADAGYRVLAPDLRGANRSEKPRGVAAYHLDELAGDILGLLDALDRERAHLLAHDFGGLVAWHLAHEHPDRVDRLAVCNCPHLTVYGRALFRSLDQLRKSWYVLYFQLPRLPEWGLAYDEYRALDTLMHRSTTSIPEAVIAGYKRALDRPGTRKALVNWYRALFRSFTKTVLTERAVPMMPIDRPTMLCWGEQDHALTVDLVEPHRDVVADLRIERFTAASHWVQFDASDPLNAALLDFLP